MQEYFIHGCLSFSIELTSNTNKELFKRNSTIAILIEEFDKGVEAFFWKLNTKIYKYICELSSINVSIIASELSEPSSDSSEISGSLSSESLSKLINNYE